MQAARSELRSSATEVRLPCDRHTILACELQVQSRGPSAWGHGGGVPRVMAFAYANARGNGLAAFRNDYAERANISRWIIAADHVPGERRGPAKRRAMRRYA